MGVDGMSNADIFDEYFDDEKPKYVIRNCPAYDCSIIEWNCLGSDATECKNGNCILKQIVELCKKIIFLNGGTDFTDEDMYKHSVGENFVAKQVLQLLDIEEVE